MGTVEDKFCFTIGYFDGCHLGHRHLFEEMISFSEKNCMKTLVVTFDKKIGSESIRNKKLFGERKDMIKQIGIDEVLEFSFDKVKSMKAIDFIINLKNQKNISVFFGTSKLCFGKDRKKFIDIKDMLYEKLNMVSKNIDVKMINNEVVSSTLIKKKLSFGDILGANNILGYFYFVKGFVQKGVSKGREIGFPTINLKIDEDVYIPMMGSYITVARIKNDFYPSMTFVGKTTLKNVNKINIETHIFNFNQDVYGEEIQIFFIDFLRKNKIFKDFRLLKETLEMDAKKTLTFFKDKYDIIQFVRDRSYEC